MFFWAQRNVPRTTPYDLMKHGRRLGSCLGSRPSPFVVRQDATRAGTVIRALNITLH